MERAFECKLVTEGYRLQITIWAVNSNDVEALAKKEAVKRLLEFYNAERAENEVRVESIREIGKEPLQ